jgi:outer membrane lipoprotein carrier protein
VGVNLPTLSAMPRSIFHLGLILALSITAHAQNPATIAAKVDHHYNTLKSLRVQFTETYAGMGMQRSESGTMLLKKPGRMRWTYTNPAGKLFVLDGKYAWFYAPGDAQVQRLPASQLDDLRSPLRFLLGHTQLEKELANLTATPTDSGFRLSGVPKGMEKRVASITLNVTADGTILSMTIEEVEGARTSFTFSKQEPNAPVTPNDFLFTPPANVPVVEGLPPV